MKKTITMESSLSELYENPAGKDILNKICIQIGIPAKLFEKAPFCKMTLGGLRKWSGQRLSAGFFDALLCMLNQEASGTAKGAGKPVRGRKDIPWWKTAVFYQIYPRSFYDSDGDGIGDLNGIIEKLDYLKELGVDAVWLSPVYDSPNDDNGYDIRDYKKIMREFGTMEDMDRLLYEAHSRGMRLIMDLVINHTSDEHPWFQKALGAADSPYREYYFFRKGEKEPNNWTSFFEGPAWRYFEKEDVWALHLFSGKQMDLNWECPKLRKDIIEMIRWWLEKGVDGFRMDVINYISKQEGLPDGDEAIGKLMGYTGIEHYFYGPKLHEYLRQLKAEAFEPYRAFSVGETPGIGMEMAKQLTAEDRRELDLVFNFDHLETPGHTRFDDYRYDLNYLKKYMIDWMEHYGTCCHMALFFENHDNPRMVSKVEPDPAYRYAVAKLLGMLQMTLRGTPFLYQGQELGMVNQHFSSPAQLRDVESWNLYEKLCRTMPAADAFAKVLAGTRDHARVPMQWEGGPCGGFTKGKNAWISGDGDAERCNAARQQENHDSVLSFYRELIGLRRDNPVFALGKFRATNVDRRNLFTYYRYEAEQVFYVECNLGRKPLYVGRRPGNLRLILSGYTKGRRKTRLLPYEANLYRVL